MSVEATIVSEVGMPGAGDRFESIRWKSGPPGPGDSGSPTIAFWWFVGILGAFLSIAISINILPYGLATGLAGLGCSLIVAARALILCFAPDANWLGRTIVESGPDGRLSQIGWWRKSRPFGLRLGHAVRGEVSRESVEFCAHCMRRLPMFWRSRVRLRLDVQRGSQQVVGVVTDDAIELHPTVNEAKDVGAVVRALELLRGRRGAVVVVLPDRVHIDIPLERKSDVGAALSIALALPVELDSVFRVQRTAGFREAALTASDEDLSRALRAAGPAVTLPAMRPPPGSPDLRPEAMLWPPPAPKDDD